MGEKSAIVKSANPANPQNNDCYFYYYSSCSKGNTCPFRHEPAALRNETVCIYWRSGNCAKENCIFRHMEITKKRDKIQCWWETQPGGCKKPHCSFQHQNILDHPREEDIKRTPDLILPVKTEGGAEKNGNERQVIPLPRVSTPPVTPTVVTPTPIIVSLFDGESDTESTGGSPQKKYEVQQYSAQTEWEIQQLRQIQAHEANLIGYMFEDDDVIQQDDEMEDGEVEEEVEEEEEEEMVVEEIEEDEDTADAAHRRLASTGINCFIGDLRSQLKSRHSSKTKYEIPENDRRERHSSKIKTNYESENDLRERLLKNRSEKIKSDTRKEYPKSRLAGRIGKLASRALEETFGRKEIKRLHKRTSENVPVNTVAERMQVSPQKKKSLLERLGTKASQESSSNSEKFSRHGQRNVEFKSRYMKEVESDNPNFAIKSLVDIKAEKDRKANKRHVPLTSSTKYESREVPNRISLNSRINESREKGSSVEIKTLSQIRAEKQKVGMTSAEVKTNRKRAISPISLSADGDKSKKLRNEIRNSYSTELKVSPTESKFSLKSLISTEPKKLITTNTDVPIVKPALGSRKISIKKSPIKPIEVITPSETQVKKLLAVKEDENKLSISTQKMSAANKQSKSTIKPTEVITPSDTPVKESPANKRNKSSIKPAEEITPSDTPVKKSPANKRSKSPIKPAEVITPSDTPVKKSPANKRGNSKKSSPKATKPSKDLENTKRKSPNKSKKAPAKPLKKGRKSTSASNLSRNDSILDEEEALLLGGDLAELDSDEEIDEDALLL